MTDCGYCGKEIVGRRSDAKYCSVRCNGSQEKRRQRERKGLAVKPQRGPNDNRSKSSTYGRDRQRKLHSKMREVTGYKGKYAKALELGYRSMFEVKVVRELEDALVDFEYEARRIPYVIQSVYTPDIILKNGIIVELKGHFDEASRRKMIAVRGQNPSLDIRMVFQVARTKISKASKTTYGQWCDKHGFKWAEGSIPLAWIAEEINNDPE